MVYMLRIIGTHHNWTLSAMQPGSLIRESKSEKAVAVTVGVYLSIQMSLYLCRM